MPGREPRQSGLDWLHKFEGSAKLRAKHGAGWRAGTEIDSGIRRKPEAKPLPTPRMRAGASQTTSSVVLGEPRARGKRLAARPVSVCCARQTSPQHARL